jgi:hypothetical protein
MKPLPALAGCLCVALLAIPAALQTYHALQEPAAALAAATRYASSGDLPAHSMNGTGGLPAIQIDYPEDGSIFPPDIAAPTFLWRDSTEKASLWTIEVQFHDGSAPIHLQSSGERLQVGEIDPRCVSPSNELPHLTPAQAAAHTWKPSPELWTAIKQHSQTAPAAIIVTGFAAGQMDAPFSEATISIQTSTDPVGAPIFYRDVPLIPSKSETGVIKPLAQSDLPLLAWRLRNVSESRSRLLLTGMHTCANCHSFSADGKTMGMDLDGPGNDKGLYTLTPVKPQMSVANQDVISWSSIRDQTASPSRIGFMSQVSPDGRYVITMLRGLKQDLADSYYVVNFKDYKFLQVFYPTRGVLAWYDRTTHSKQPLPGADDPSYVQTNPVWTPDQKYIIFARAHARQPLAPGQPLPDHANAPEETQIQFDLYRIPFNNGKGGAAVPIPGASNDGMSNSFPKVSPDGRWIVFVKNRNGLLIRPDSKLYVVPVEGGVARPLRSNLPLMNSWHSFSPNGRWLVFSSKSRTPYTQMFLTHFDAYGNASPAILIDNATAANRAVNIPEFVNIPADGMMKIDVPAAESYRLFDVATDYTAKGFLQEAIAAWKRVLALDPVNARAEMNLGIALQIAGNVAEGARHLEKARQIDPDINVTDSNYGIAFFNREQFRTAVKSSDCSSVMEYGNKLLAVSSGDAEVIRAMAGCTPQKNRKRE